jgi:hypothetical protein
MQPTCGAGEKKLFRLSNADFVAYDAIGREQKDVCRKTRGQAALRSSKGNAEQSNEGNE